MDYYSEFEKITSASPEELRDMILKRFKPQKYKLYQYCSFDEDYDLVKNTKPDCDYNYGYKNLVQKIVYAASPSRFNDPFDCAIGFSSESMLGDILKSFLNLEYVDMKVDKKVIKNLFMDYDSREERLEEVLTWKASIIRDILIEVFQNEHIYKRFMNKKGYDKKPLNIAEKKQIMRDILGQKGFQESFLEHFLDKKFMNETNYNALKNMFDNNRILIDSIVLEPVTINTNNNNGIDEIKVDLDKINILGSHHGLNSVSNQTLMMRETLNNAYLMATDGLKKFKDKIDAHFGITCFSKACDLPLMWSHYANKHKGFVIEYDLTKLTSNDVLKLPFLLNVKYQSKRPRLDPYELQKLQNNATGENVIAILNKTFYDVMFIKSIIWKKELETRNVILVKKEEDRKIPFDCVSSIYLGVNSGEKLRTLMTELCEKEIYNLYQFEMDKDEYKISKLKIF